jgi:thioesterase domain-containing protein/acyl carrier protein
LVCYIVPFDRAAFSLGGLRTFLRTKLPEYMIPSRYVLLDSLPLTSNGKINRPALPAPAGQYSPESAGFTAPRNSIEEKLAELWILLLGLPRVGIHDDFFDLGAHSLLAARLLAQIDRTFGKRLTMASLFAKPTIAALAAELESDCKQNSQESSSLIVAIKSDGLRPPLICIHGIAGHVLKYYRLAQCLDPKQPVYGLKSPNFGSDIFRDSVEDIAETYVRELRRFQSHGPYYLAGFSFGGLVAYEMANRLVAENEQIGMLALFDTGNLAAIQKQVQGSATHRWFGRITDKWKRSWNDPKSSRCTNWRRAVMAATDLGEAFAWRGWKSTYKFCRRHGYPTPAFLQDIMKIYLLAGQSYRPQPFPGRITLFRAETRDQVFEGDAKLGWGALALGGLDIHEIPCEHLSILETPSVLVLGDRLQLCLSTAQAEGM